MPTCCYSDEYATVFNAAEARAMARRFRMRGPLGTSADVVALLEAEGIAGATLLEVGAGVGEVLITLLERGARRALDVDLSPTWARAASDEAAARALGDRWESRIGDFVDVAPSLPPADVVILNRVVCCYPDWRAMLDAAAWRSAGLVAVSAPVDTVWMRPIFALINVYYRLRRLRFRVFVHPEAAMDALLAERGFGATRQRRGLVWRTVVYRRRGMADG